MQYKFMTRMEISLNSAKFETPGANLSGMVIGVTNQISGQRSLKSNSKFKIEMMAFSG
jgi:hypothetical protein